VDNLKRAVSEELAKMIARNLPYAPSPEDMPATIAVMVDDLRRLGLDDKDAPRVAEAMSIIALQAERWPTVSMVRAALPPPIPQKLFKPQLPIAVREHLKQLGLTPRLGETERELAARCKQWLIENKVRIPSPEIEAELRRGMAEARKEREAIQAEEKE
jgi:hypothetical protein